MKAFILIAVSFVSGLFAGPSEMTIQKNKQLLTELPFADDQDFQDASRGFIAPLPGGGVIKDREGRVVWDLTQYKFLDTDKGPPSTVNPSLWRQAKLLYLSGLFQITDRIYQIRSADLSNMTIIEGDEGIIIVDTLISNETAKAALDLYYTNRGKKPITAIIFTHSHIDHFGGVEGIVTQQEVSEKNIKVVAPEGFTEAAFTENILAGNVMQRRSGYMYGNLISKGAKGQVSSGLGLTTSTGNNSFLAPNILVGKTGSMLTLDGVDFVFVFAPDSEAPAEMLFYLPQFQALCAAEDATHTLHNVYSLRGAKIRDAKAWAKYLNQTIEMFGKDMKVVFAQHHWPVWSNERCVDFLEKQRDMYKYLNDQTLRLANQGYTMTEIAEMIKLPESLSKQWYNRGYYGSVSHNTKAIYSFYLGWFDGNPSTLDPLPRIEGSKKYVEYMGGSSAIYHRAKKDFSEGNYRWAAEVLNHVVFAEPENHEARALLADSLEQMAYQSENATWRNFYLTGALELRSGVQKKKMSMQCKGGVITNLPTESLFDYLAIHLNGPKAAENPIRLNFNFPDTNEKFFLKTDNGVLNYFPEENRDDADATILMDRSMLNDVFLHQITMGEALMTRKIKVKGDKFALEKFFSLLDKFDPWFNIIEPVSGK